MSTPFPPMEPPPTGVQFPDPRKSGSREILALGEDFSPGTLLSAYRLGIFPWPHGRKVPWCCPDPRAHFALTRPPHWSRSLRRTLRHNPFEITMDTAFESVMRLCGTTRPEGTWITPAMVRGYQSLHNLGWAHSLEVWAGVGEERTLVGGIYGVAVGGAFAGESMFHLVTDASKIAFASLVDRLRTAGYVLFDVQVMNPHLESLGCEEMRRADYLDMLADARQISPLQLQTFG